jgi:hypothetical protein
MFSRSASSMMAWRPVVIEQALDQIAPVRDVRADHRGFQVAKVHAQDALGHAHGALVAFVVVDQFAQVDRRGELHAGLAPQNDDAQQRRRRPVTAQLSANSSFHGLDSLSGDWPQNTLTGMICASSAAFWLRALTRRVRVGGAPRLSWRPSQSGRGSGRRTQRVQQGPPHRQHRAWQAGGAFGVDHGQVGERRRLQDVEHRAAAVRFRVRDDWLIVSERTQRYNSRRRCQRQTAERGTGHTASA